MNKILPIVGILGEKTAPSPTSAFQTFKRQGCVETYTQAIEKLNAIAMIIPYISNQNEKIITSYISHVDALLLPGGFDIDPQLYGEKRKEECQKSDLNFDMLALSLVKEALRVRKPILGICKGCQIINVALNGTLFQDQKYDLRESKETNHFDLDNIDSPSHKVLINKDSRLNNIFGSQLIEVNSLHHQSINQVGEDLNLSALSLDGSVEAIEHSDKDYFCIGVQWHPETLLTKTPTMLPLFKAFIDSI